MTSFQYDDFSQLLRKLYFVCDIYKLNYNSCATSVNACFLNPILTCTFPLFLVINRSYVVLSVSYLELTTSNNGQAGNTNPTHETKPLFHLLVGHSTKQIDHTLLKMRYLSSAHYSYMYTLSETGNTIKNLLKYAPYISWNNKGGRDSPIMQRL